LTTPGGSFTSGDVRTTVGAIARAKAITARAFDLGGKDLGKASTQRTESGWEIKPPASTVRLEAAVK